MSDWFRKQPKIVKSLLAGYPQGSPDQPAPTPEPPLPTRTPVPAAKPGQAWADATIPTALPENMQDASAKVVMHHFARGEVRNIEKGADRLHAAVVAKLRSLPEFRRVPDAVIRAVIQGMTRHLQASDLTINFRASNWFDRPNHSKTYLQMYERGAKKVKGADGSEELHIQTGAMNNAGARDTADTRVTFGANVSTPGMQGVARFMQTGGGKTVKNDMSTIMIPNKHFNPKARQNFAALNYHGGKNGGATGYGSSFLVLNDSFKRHAIYYMGDTFDPNISAASRATYGTLASLLLYADAQVLKGLIDSCHRGMHLPDTNGKYMIEAHVFQAIRFKGGAVAMYLDPVTLGEKMLAWNGTGPRPDADTVLSNAKIFCHMNGIKLHMIK